MAFTKAPKSSLNEAVEIDWRVPGVEESADEACEAGDAAAFAPVDEGVEVAASKLLSEEETVAEESGVC